MSVLKTDVFIIDVEQQYEWYLNKAGELVADRYLMAVESTCHLLDSHPFLGLHAGFIHPRLRDWRYILAYRPYRNDILFYELVNNNAIMHRAMKENAICLLD
jgi:plasmid stabilization system protein ParE